MIKTIFLGSGDFAVPILEKLKELDYVELIAVITQPDKPVGRKQLLTPTPIGEYVKNLTGVEILKPEKLKSEELLSKYNPELIIVASYGQIIPSDIVNFPKYKSLNFHGSLLPKLRGAVPVQMAILQGLTETGVTLQVMAEGMDEGDIISQSNIEIKPEDTTESLMSALAELSVGMLENDLPKWIDGTLKTVQQDESSATYCYKSELSKDKAEITKDTNTELAERMIRAFYPWPVAWTRLSSGKTLKIFKSKLVSDRELGLMEYELSDVLKIVRREKQLFLILSDGILELLEVQLEGKKVGAASDYLFLAN